MPTQTAAGAGEDAPETSEPRAPRERRPTRRAIVATESESAVSAAPARRQGRSQARAANPKKTVVLDLEPVVMGNRRDDDADDAADAADHAADDSHDVVMQDSEPLPRDEPEPESESHTEPEHEKESDLVATPRRRGRQVERRPKGGGTPSKASASILKTPVKSSGLRPTAYTPGRAADRSARRKSARALIRRAMHDGASDDEHTGERLAREIYESSDDEGEENDHNGDNDEDDNDDENESAAATPSKRPRGRQAGQAKRSLGKRKKARSPTPPRDLPRHEAYFLHNKPGRPRTSDNTLSSLALLTHDEYFAAVRGHCDRHAEDIAFLEALHAESFPQWAFELSQGFGVCLYGFGSKRALLRRFAGAVHARDRGTRNRIVMVNGYAPTTTLREILNTVNAAIASASGSTNHPPRPLPAGQPSTMAQAVLAQLSATTATLTLAINSVDAPPLRKPGAQAVLAQLAAHPQVRLVCTADTPDFPLLWDMGLRSAFNFVFHDCTTFAPFRAEIDVVDQVHELLGRQAQRANGREGVAFVLKSLTENAKNLFRLLVGEVLVAMDDDDDGGGGGAGAGAAGDDGVGLEYRMLYNKAVEEFICSSEMAFRTLLKEFHDHQMITSRKDALGTELLSLPFRKEDLEAILEDLSM